MSGQRTRSLSAETTLLYGLSLSNIVLRTVDQSRAAHRRLLEKKKECNGFYGLYVYMHFGRKQESNWVRVHFKK